MGNTLFPESSFVYGKKVKLLEGFFFYWTDRINRRLFVLVCYFFHGGLGMVGVFFDVFFAYT